MTMSAETTFHVPEIGVADRCRAARVDAGMTQEQLAAAIDGAKATVANYESRSWTRKRRVSTLKLWALATGVPPEWLIDGTDPGREGGPGPNGTGTSNEYAPWDLNPEPAGSVIPLTTWRDPADMGQVAA